jgi:flagellar motor switch protein FliG
MELTGPEKAVLMLLSLDEASATPILSELDADDVRKLRDVASLMRAVPASALSNVYSEFLQRSSEAVAVPRGGVRYLRRIATRALGEATAQEIFVDAPQTAMERLATTDATALASVLENEHPQIVAAVLSQLEADHAAAVLAGLPDDNMRAVVLERLAALHEIPAGLLEEVAGALSAELPSSEVEASMSVDGLARSAALVRRLGRGTGEALLGRVSENDAELAATIRKNMYRFEDLLAVDARALRSLLEAVPTDRLVLAMKTASEDMKEHLFKGMSKRAGDRIRDDLALLGAVKLSDVEAAQQEIVEAALALDAEGVISLDGQAGTVE